jgi:multidrug efflux pump subunit AcrA (membrane-fusion protein)
VKKLLLFILIAASAAFGIYVWRFGPRNHTLSESKLTFVSLEQVTMRDTVGAIGMLEACEPIVVGSEMPGVVQGVLGKINQVVTEGAVLAHLDDRKLKLKREEADNGVRTARAALLQAQSVRDAAEAALKTQNDSPSTWPSSRCPDRFPSAPSASF